MVFKKGRGSSLKKLREFVETHEGVEGYMEPQTPILDQSLLLIARDGEWVRAAADRGQAASFCKKAGIPFYDAGVVGYPDRMRGHKGAAAPPAPTAEELEAWFSEQGKEKG